MEAVITIHIEQLPEGVYLSTSDMLQGLVAQGRTIRETLDIARDVAKMLLEAGQEPQKELFFTQESFINRSSQGHFLYDSNSPRGNPDWRMID